MIPELSDDLRERVVELADYGRQGYLQAVSEVHAQTRCGILAAKRVVTEVQEAAAEADYWSPEPMSTESARWMARQGVRR